MIARLLAVGLGGFLGATARYAVGLGVAQWWRRDFPLATFLVNISGCFILGFIVSVATPRLTELTRLFIGTGFVGAYTTFSTFELEAHQLAPLSAAAYVASSVFVGYLAVRLGIAAAR
jgi:CrcB protein